MPLIDIFKRRASSSASSSAAAAARTTPSPPPPPLPPAPPQFLFVRTDTTTQEIVHPPAFPGDIPTTLPTTNPTTLQPFAPLPATGAPAARPRSSSSSTQRLRSHLPFKHRRSHSSSSLTSIPPPATPAEWEKRATTLIDTPHSPAIALNCDATIQDALQLYDKGDLAEATEIFGRLAKPPTSNPLAQVFYGLALRHGWGVERDAGAAVGYLKLAAANSGAVEAIAAGEGLKDGGKAKGELALAVYELGNSYRQGWGVEKDLWRAREYYEAAAELGEVDAMNEAGWCWEEGVGGKRDRMKAARFYRMAEKAGAKTVGNSWIYKDKYMVDEK